MNTSNHLRQPNTTFHHLHRVSRQPLRHRRTRKTSITHNSHKHSLIRVSCLRSRRSIDTKQVNTWIPKLPQLNRTKHHLKINLSSLNTKLMVLLSRKVSPHKDKTLTSIIPIKSHQGPLSLNHLWRSALTKPPARIIPRLW